MEEGNLTKQIILNNKKFKLYLKQNEIVKINKQLAKKIEQDLEPKIETIFIVVLSGACFFATDLTRLINCNNSKIDFLRLASYHTETKSSGKVRKVMDKIEHITGKNIIVLEDIIESGNTLEYLYNYFLKNNANSVKIATFLFKPMCFNKKKLKIDYIGKEITQDFIVGYGLDYQGFGRSLPDIYQIIE